AAPRSDRPRADGGDAGAAAAGPAVRAAPGAAVAELPVPGVVDALPARVGPVGVVAADTGGVLVPGDDVAGAGAVLPAAGLVGQAHHRLPALDAALGVVAGVVAARAGGGVGPVLEERGLRLLGPPVDQGEGAQTDDGAGPQHPGEET